MGRRRELYRGVTQVNVRFVLVEPSHPGNIGAAARAMRVMGWRDLALVRPQQFPRAEATAMAAGADDILAAAQVCETLTDALADCRIAFGTSARHRSLGWPECDARGAASMAAERGGDVAFVFGRERSGLTNAELDECKYMLHIPTAPDYGSLNLAQAVQIVAYECRLVATADTPTAEESPQEAMPTHADMHRFYGHLERALTDLGFLDPANPRHLVRRLRRLFNRSNPSANELSILRGILSAAQRPAPGSPAARSRAGDSPFQSRDESERGP